MGTKYTLYFTNGLAKGTTACVYQTDPDSNLSGVMSLAWFTHKTNAGVGVQFDWTIDYNFVWSQMGVVKPGINFKASETRDAFPDGTNMITLDKNGFGYGFDDLREYPVGAPDGSLHITETANVVIGQAAIGVGMSGFGTFAVGAEPNINATFTPHPSYWIASGSFQPGEVLDIQLVNNPGEIIFPQGVFEMYATLNSNNSWTISETAPASAANLKFELHNPAQAYKEAYEKV